MFFFHFCISDLINIQLEHLEVTKIFFQKVYPRNLFNFESGTSHPTLISYFITPANIYRIFTFSSFLQNRRNVRQFNILVHQICCSPHIPITSLSSITARISCSNQMKQSEHIKQIHASSFLSIFIHYILLLSLSHSLSLSVSLSLSLSIYLSTFQNINRSSQL